MKERKLEVTPMLNLLRYHGVLSPAARWRSSIVPFPPEAVDPVHHGRCRAGKQPAHSEKSQPRCCHPRNHAWAGLTVFRFSWINRRGEDFPSVSSKKLEEQDLPAQHGTAGGGIKGHDGLGIFLLDRECNPTFHRLVCLRHTAQFRLGRGNRDAFIFF
jgi:hypothetical protein